MKSRFLIAAMLFALPVASASAKSTLRGSHASMVRQHRIAVKNDYTFLRTPKQVREFAASDRLEKVDDTDTYRTEGVSFPYARPVVKLFIERLAEQYHDATGNVLVVTSLTRPITRQPRNASPLSVHPAGMAVDFRVPANRQARTWLEQTLLSLEDKSLLDVTRERHPSHYHVAVFPDNYADHVARLTAATTAAIAQVTKAPSAVSAAVTHAATSIAAARMSASASPGAVPAIVLGLLILLGGGAYAYAARIRR